MYQVFVTRGAPLVQSRLVFGGGKLCPKNPTVKVPILILYLCTFCLSTTCCVSWNAETTTYRAHRPFYLTIIEKCKDSANSLAHDFTDTETCCFVRASGLGSRKGGEQTTDDR